MEVIAVCLSPRARLTRPRFATALQYLDRLLGARITHAFAGCKHASDPNIKILFSIESPPQKAPPTVLKQGFPLRHHPPFVATREFSFFSECSGRRPVGRSKLTPLRLLRVH